MREQIYIFVDELKNKSLSEKVIDAWYFFGDKLKGRRSLKPLEEKKYEIVRQPYLKMSRHAFLRSNILIYILTFLVTFMIQASFENIQEFSTAFDNISHLAGSFIAPIVVYLVPSYLYCKAFQCDDDMKRKR